MQRSRKLIGFHITFSLTKIGKKWIPVMARVIPGVALLLLVGMNFRDGHAECPTMQRQVNDLNAPRIFFFRDSKAPISNITLKHLNRIHRDMDHPDHTQMATECIRLGHKVSKAVELRISRVIQECQVCKDKDRNFPMVMVKSITQPSTWIYW